MASKISICSQALLMVGDRPIASFDEGNDRAMLCSNLYEDARRATLRAHPWNCAIKRDTLAPTSTAPAYEYSYAFNLPADCLRVLSIGDDNSAEYKIEGRQILYDDNTLPIRYIFDNTDENSFDALLIEAITFQMASRMAYPIAKSASLQQQLQSLYADVLKRAQGVDAQEDTPEEFGDTPLISVRY